ncbi:MAG: hypothetical protein BroJett025_10940 [Patescibacteria group bacterium]|nr:MAG: hypothetical protein BroJett025_10940 [Patescibacteria group bacterium]
MKVFLIKAIRQIILSIFTVLIFAGVLFSPQLSITKQTFAADGCAYAGHCINNKKCVCPIPGYYDCRYSPQALVLGEEPCGSAIIGGVEPPAAVGAINAASGGDIGLIFFISRAIGFANIVAGILVMINFVVAGFLYVTGAGNPSNMAKINERMLWSFVGILIIVGSYSLAALFGLIFYGDPTFIITPTLTGAV